MLCMAGSTPGGPGNIWGPGCLLSVSVCNSLHRKTWVRFAFFCLISVFSGNDFPTVKVGLSFRKEQKSAVGWASPAGSRTSRKHTAKAEGLP